MTDVVPELRELVAQLPDGFTVAVMGCEVNGPREARHAQLGIAGSPAGLVVFREGEIVARVEKGSSVVDALRPYLPKKS